MSIVYLSIFLYHLQFLSEVSCSFLSTGVLPLAKFFPRYFALFDGTVNQIFSLISLFTAAAAAAKSLQSCLTLCNPIDGSPPGSAIPGILQARTLEWVAIYFSNVWKWKWSCSVMSDSQRPHGLQPTRLLHPWDFLGKSTSRVPLPCLLVYGNTTCFCILILYSTFYCII